MKRILLFVLGTAGDASWFLLGFAVWALTLCAESITVECNLSKHSFRFPGWWR